MLLCKIVESRERCNAVQMGRFGLLVSRFFALGARGRSKVCEERPWAELYVFSHSPGCCCYCCFLQDLTPARTELAGPTVDRWEGFKSKQGRGWQTQVGMQQGRSLVSTVAAKSKKARLVISVSHCIVAFSRALIPAFRLFSRSPLQEKEWSVNTHLARPWQDEDEVVEKKKKMMMTTTATATATTTTRRKKSPLLGWRNNRL